MDVTVSHLDPTIDVNALGVTSMRWDGRHLTAQTRSIDVKGTSMTSGLAFYILGAGETIYHSILCQHEENSLGLLC